MARAESIDAGIAFAAASSRPITAAGRPETSRVVGLEGVLGLALAHRRHFPDRHIVDPDIGKSDLTRAMVRRLFVAARARADMQHLERRAAITPA